MPGRRRLTTLLYAFQREPRDVLSLPRPPTLCPLSFSRRRHSLPLSFFFSPFFLSIIPLPSRLAPISVRFQLDHVAREKRETNSKLCRTYASLLRILLVLFSDSSSSVSSVSPAGRREQNLPSSSTRVRLLVFSAPPHNTRAIASYWIAGTSLSILPYI